MTMEHWIKQQSVDQFASCWDLVKHIGIEDWLQEAAEISVFLFQVEACGQIWPSIDYIALIYTIYRI